MTHSNERKKQPWFCPNQCRTLRSEYKRLRYEHAPVVTFKIVFKPKKNTKLTKKKKTVIVRVIYLICLREPDDRNKASKPLRDDKWQNDWKITLVDTTKKMLNAAICKISKILQWMEDLGYISGLSSTFNKEQSSCNSHLLIFCKTSPKSMSKSK